MPFDNLYTMKMIEIYNFHPCSLYQSADNLEKLKEYVK